jgi:hypothetical protein
MKNFGMERAKTIHAPAAFVQNRTRISPALARGYGAAGELHESIPAYEVRDNSCKSCLKSQHA